MIGCGEPINPTPVNPPDSPKSNPLDDNETHNGIIAEAIHESELQKRVDQEGNELLYAPGKQTPYTGWTKMIYENGQVEFLTRFQDGKTHGPFIMWYENGQKESEEKYKEGKPHGLFTDWYENGRKAGISNYKDGNRDGFQAEWYDNGRKFFEKNVKEGLKDGLYVTWYANGHKKSEGNYKEDKKDGLWVDYNEDGTEYRRLTYYAGKEIRD